MTIYRYDDILMMVFKSINMIFGFRYAAAVSLSMETLCRGP